MGFSGIVLAAAQGFFLLVCLTILYRILFRRKSPRAWGQCIINRTRIWAYICIFMVSALWFIYQWSAVTGRQVGFRVLLFLTCATVAILIVESISALVYDYYLIQKKQASIPTIFRDLARGMIYLVLVGLYFWGVLHIDVVPIFTTSAIISIILGLALQDTLGNVFSGLAVHMSHPFSIGDWIKIGAYEGRVDKIDWRSTSIQTLSGDYVVIPNSSLSKLDLQNYSSPTTLHARTITVGAHYSHAPNQVCDTVVTAARAADGVLADPPPQVRVAEYGDCSIVYDLKFWLDDFSRHDEIESNVRKQIWYHFKRTGISIPFPIRDIYHHNAESAGSDILSDGSILLKIDFFKPMNPEEMKALTSRLRHEIYPRGDILFNQGDKGDRFYVVKSGEVEINVAGDSGEILFTTVLGPGEFFGELSLLTGAPRSAAARFRNDTELLSLGKNDLRDLISNHPNLDEMICDALTERQKRTKKVLEKKDELSAATGDADGDESMQRSQLLNRIRTFFAY